VVERQLAVHVFGSFAITRYAWPHLRRSGSGRVVMTSSKAALWGSTPGLSAYGAAKGAMLGLTRQLAAEGAPDGIAVNAVFPTAITMASHPRLAEVAADLGEEDPDPAVIAARSSALVAAVVAWLCHPDCNASGQFFKAQSGHVQLVSFAMNPGVEDHELSVARVRDDFAKILDTSELRVVSPLPAGAKG
jgi:NAD(P)-dependent dehydrogenase (short-subunit alcohol dehydrogenase family)